MALTVIVIVATTPEDIPGLHAVIDQLVPRRSAQVTPPITVAEPVQEVQPAPKHHPVPEVVHGWCPQCRAPRQASRRRPGYASRCERCGAVVLCDLCGAEYGPRHERDHLVEDLIVTGAGYWSSGRTGARVHVWPDGSTYRLPADLR